MPITKKTYKIGKLQQLIDLNQDSTNFKAEFKVAAKDQDKIFNVLIANQSQLDDPNIINLEFKEAKGQIGGSIMADKNIFQNYFVILKSNDDQEVDLEITLEPLPDNIPQPPNPNTQVQQLPSPPQKTSFLKSKYFVWILVGIIGLVLLYFIYTNYYAKKKENNTRSIEPTPNQSKNPSPLSSHHPTPVHSPKKPRALRSPNSILAKLKASKEA